MRFEFATCNRIVFGCGVVDQIGPLAAETGKRVLVVTGSDRNRPARLLSILSKNGVDSSVYGVSGEPTIEQAREGARYALEEGCEAVVAMGGGSVLDAGKAIAALCTNPGDPLDFVEVIGRGQPLKEDPLPIFAIPTTAGTGSEVTRNAVLTSQEQGVKVSLRSARMLPRLAIVDPELTCTMPPAVTAATGLDAIAQLVEPFVSQRANPLVDGMCREGLQLAARSLRKAYNDGRDIKARTEMSLASLFGGLALANAGLGAAHGFAAVLGGMFRAAHGALCARLLGPVMSANIAALQDRGRTSPALARYDEIGRLLTGDATAKAREGVVWIEETCETLLVPRLSHYGLGAQHVSSVISKAEKASSMQANPIALTPAEMASVLLQAL